METKDSLSCDGRVDPWECYQDTWQTTCSVLEHHRDLMKVSQAMAKGGWMSRVQERDGRKRLLAWCPAALASASCFPASC